MRRSFHQISEQFRKLSIHWRRPSLKIAARQTAAKPVRAAKTVRSVRLARNAKPASLASGTSANRSVIVIAVIVIVVMMGHKEDI